ncbi:alpha/beta fold hydrolase [Streptomyces bauhiniae]|uniref:alpha/beta fold hydrolase n=1 Tax=Streptomyces TaxID=1883 RepID=UPI00136D4033|nr:alpha/beta hydrolase [Streptomyces sp. SID2999]MYZ08098.1 alpha/beta fold hydrolase [Streptomyces sp. SID2999]
MSTVESVRQDAEGSVTVDGVEVRYFDHATAPAAGDDRAPIVLVHGTGGSTQKHFAYLLPLLATRQRVVSVDLAQPVPAEGTLTVEHLERQVAAVVEAVLPGRAVTLVGYSLGSVVASAVAAHRPDLVRNLVLVAGWITTDTQQKLRNRVWHELRETGSSALGAYTAFCAFGGPYLAHVTLDQLAPVLTAAPPSDFDALQMALNQRVDISGLVPRIEATTLIVGCTHDQMVPVRHSKALFGAIQDARYTEIESGHAVVFERPAQLVQIIDQFNEAPARHAAGSIIPTARP